MMSESVLTLRNGANPDDLNKLYVRSRDGRLVELRNLVRIQEGGGPSVIDRVDRQRSISLFASLEEKPLGQAVEELNAIARPDICRPTIFPNTGGRLKR